jgi:hypothetical protein
MSRKWLSWLQWRVPWLLAGLLVLLSVPLLVPVFLVPLSVPLFLEEAEGLVEVWGLGMLTSY